MPFYQIDVEKRREQETWTNVYNVFASDVSQAQIAGATIAAAEQDFHGNDVEFTRFRVKELSEGSIGFLTPLGFNGERADAGQSSLPLFNVVRVDFSVPFSRPSRKYYRTPILEIEQSDGELLQTVASGITNRVNQLITTMAAQGTPLIDVDGEAIGAALTFPQVGMRQLRRGRNDVPHPC